MRLSEAILLGSLTKRPEGGMYLSENNGACALGMAGVAAGIQHSDSTIFFVELERTWPWMTRTPFNSMELPCGCHLGGFFPSASVGEVKCGFAITHLFDRHVTGIEDWTLEQLVDWVRSVEPAESTPVTEQQPDLQTFLEAVNTKA